MNPVSRRTVLGLAAAAAAGGTVLAAAPPARGATTTSATPDWAALDRAMTGGVWLPGSSGYAGGKQVFNPLFDGLAPAAVARPVSVGDVAQAVAFARRYGLRVSPRSGGHSYVGASAATGTLVVDLRSMASTTYVPATGQATVQGGAGLWSVHAALAAHGRTVPTGSCPTVGVSGLTLGGGLGVESRQWGLTADRLVSAGVVLPDGTITTASPARHPDLFWSLRGGGGGHGAVVTSFTFATHAATSKGIVLMTFAGSAATTVLTGWSRWIAGATRGRWVGLQVVGGSTGVFVRVAGVTAAGDERAMADSFISAVGVRPLTASYRQLGYLDAMRFLGGGTTSARETFVAGSDVLPAISAAAAAAIVGVISARVRSGRTATAIIDPAGGAVSSLGTTATPFPWRHHLASVQWHASVSASTAAAARSWIASAHSAVRSFSSGGYVNYVEAGAPSSRYFGPNLARLRQVWRAYDRPRSLVGH